MVLVPVVAPADGTSVDLEDIGSSVESLSRVVKFQKGLFQSQIDRLQVLVVVQWKLTGVNPLSQEMVLHFVFGAGCGCTLNQNWHDWDMLKSLLSIRLKQVLSEYPEAKVASGDGPQPSSLSGETYPELVRRLDEEVVMKPPWRVGAGENSKEVTVQTQRNGREKETFYSNPQDIPLEQTDDLETPAAAAAAAASDDADASPSSSPCDNSRAATAEDSTASTSAAAAAPPPAATTGHGLPEPDIELLAALLKNPDIVYALTSGQGKNLTNNKKVALLNLVKTTGIGLAGIVNEFASVTKEMQVPVPDPEPEPEPTSLPSPTPPASATQVGWRSTQLQPQYSITTSPNLASRALLPPPPPPPPPTIPMDAIHPSANHMAFNHHQAPSLLVPPQVPTTILPPPQLTVPANPCPPQQHHHRLPAPNLQPTMMTTTASSYNHAPLRQTPNPPEIILPPGHYQSNHYPSPMPLFPPPPMKPQLRALPQTVSYPPRAPAWPPSAGAAFEGGQNPVPVSDWIGYPSNFINGPVVYPADSNNTNNNYNSNNMYPWGRNEYPNGSGMETWGARSWQSSDVRYDQNFSDPRREYVMSQQAEPSRQGYFQHNNDKWWQNRDRDCNKRR